MKVAVSEKQKQIHDKGFSLTGRTSPQNYSIGSIDFNKIKVGVKNLDDAQLNLGSLKQKDGVGGKCTEKQWNSEIIFYIYVCV